jgi:hypothetical protein
MHIPRRAEIAAAAAVAAAVLAIGVGASAVADGATGGTTEPDHSAEPWFAGLMARSEALNAQHGLGEGAPGGGPGALPDYSGEPWFAGLMARSEALNAQYGLGDYARSGDRPDWVVRANALARVGAGGEGAAR